MRCYHCDQPLTQGEHFCPRCGTAADAPQQVQQAQQVVCPVCRAAVPPGSSFCPACGAALRAGAAPLCRSGRRLNSCRAALVA